MTFDGFLPAANVLLPVGYRHMHMHTRAAITLWSGVVRSSGRRRLLNLKEIKREKAKKRRKGGEERKTKMQSRGRYPDTC